MEVDPILQLPELPTGCEITTLAMLLDAVGFQVDKVQLAEGYLTCKSEGEATSLVRRTTLPDMAVMLRLS